MVSLSSLDIYVSDVGVQRVRMDIAAENITHINITRAEAGGPYQRKDVLLESSGVDSFREATRSAAMGDGFASRHAGVRVSGIIEDNGEMKRVCNPGYPDVDAKGYANMPNADLLKETVDSVSATGSYETSITALNIMKPMAQKVLSIGR